jgi:hypothetical protein
MVVSFIGGGNLEKTSNLSQVTDKLYHIMLYTLPWSRFELTTSVVKGTDYICGCKLNYHTITPRRPLLLLVEMYSFHPVCPSIWKVCTWKSSNILYGNFLKLLVLPYYHKKICWSLQQFDWTISLSYCLFWLLTLFMPGMKIHKSLLYNDYTSLIVPFFSRSYCPFILWHLIRPSSYCDNLIMYCYYF